MKRRARRWIRRVVIGGAAFCLAGVVIGWFLFQRIPSWYRPIELHPEDEQTVRNDLAGTQDVLGEQMVHADGRFQYRFTQDQINCWLAAREAIWPLSREWLPPELSDPFVVLDEEGVRIAATYTRGSVRSVVSARLGIAAGRDRIRIVLRGVSGGSLPVPVSWIADRLAAMDVELMPERSEGAAGPVEGHVPRLSDLPGGIEIPNEWEWHLPKIPFRVTGVDFEAGAVVVTFEPERST